MSISFGKITYINNSIRDIIPEVPILKVVIYNDKYIDKTYFIMYTQNNKYIKEFEFDYFAKIYNDIKSVMNLPYDPTLALYYGDELQIEVKFDDSSHVFWQSIKSDVCIKPPSAPWFIDDAVRGQRLGNELNFVRAKHKLTKENQMMYDKITSHLFGLTTTVFKGKIPETFFKGY